MIKDLQNIQNLNYIKNKFNKENQNIVILLNLILKISFIMKICHKYQLNIITNKQ